jgi:hypothetical protein
MLGGKKMSEDIMRDMCIRQGYVPKTCMLPGQLIFGLVNEQGDPCNGCNHDREICKGRESKKIPPLFLLNRRKENERSITNN